jgi:hypothetical protein
MREDKEKISIMGRWEERQISTGNVWLKPKEWFGVNNEKSNLRTPD